MAKGTLKVGTDIGRRGFEAAVLLGDARDLRLASGSASFCHGRRHFGRPMMALATKKSLGPVRHALSQMVVAGTVLVQQPVQVRITASQGEEGSDGSV